MNAALHLPILVAPSGAATLTLTGTATYGAYSASGTAKRGLELTGTATYSGYSALGTAQRGRVVSGTGLYGAYSASGAAEVVAPASTVTLSGSGSYGAYIASGTAFHSGTAPATVGGKVHFHYDLREEKPKRRRRRKPQVPPAIESLPAAPELALGPTELPSLDPQVLRPRRMAIGRAEYGAYAGTGRLTVDDTPQILEMIEIMEMAGVIDD